MYKTHGFHLLDLWQRTCKYILAFTWIFGLLLGVYAAAHSGNSFSLMMRGYDFTVSISGLLLMNALPFLLSALAVYLSQPILLLTVVAFKAFLFGYCCCGLMTVYGDDFWLMQLLLMFSDLALSPLLMWFWVRCLQQPGQCSVQAGLIFSVVIIAVTAVDICIVSPLVTLLL